jgi:hypothetical protein
VASYRGGVRNPPPERAYLDAASSEPLHPAARHVLLAALDSGWADPARLHHEGRTARLLWDNAREVVADARRPAGRGFLHPVGYGGGAHRRDRNRRGRAPHRLVRCCHCCRPT